MITQQSHWLTAVGAAVLLICAASAAAQQSAAAPATPSSAAAPADAPSAQGNIPAQRQPMGANQQQRLKRDAPAAAKPAGFNPRFSLEGEHFGQQGGARLYQAICQGCHMPQGQGAEGAGFYPALANNPRLASGAYPTYVVLSGLRGMPSFAGRLTDQQVADVVNYVRTSFGNNYPDAVTPEAVNGQRPAQER